VVPKGGSKTNKMKLSSLKEYFSEESYYIHLIAEADGEVNDYVKRGKKKGASVPVIVVEDIEELIIGPSELKILCASFLEGHLNISFVNYIADILGLSQRITFTDEIVREFFEEMTDPEINGELTRARVLEILISASDQ
jgi:hypothetical protein